MKRKRRVKRSDKATIAGDEKPVKAVVNTRSKPKSKPKTPQKYQSSACSSSSSSLINTLNKPLSTNMMITLSPDFFRIDSLELAPRLLGKYLRKDDVVLQITEVFYIMLILLVTFFTFNNLGIIFVVVAYVCVFYMFRLKLIGQVIQLVMVDLALLQELPLLSVTLISLSHFIFCHCKCFQYCG